MKNKVTSIKEIDHLPNKLLIVKQILLVITLKTSREKYEEYSYWNEDAEGCCTQPSTRKATTAFLQVL